MYASYTEIFFAVCILLLPFLYESSHVFRYHLKFMLYYTIVMINSVILIPVFVFRAGNVRNLLTASAFCHHISTLLGLRWIIRGREHLEKDQACIIVSNHQSSLDILGMFDVWPVMDKCTVVAKKELFYAWPFGLAAWLCGLIFIPRMNSDKARELMNDAAEGIKKNKVYEYTVSVVFTMYAFYYTEILLAVCILLLPFLYESSNVFRYHLKFILYYTIVVINSIILLPVFVFRARNVRNALTGSAFCRHISTLLGLRWIIRGREHLEKDQAFIIVSNHQSSLDTLGVLIGMCHVWPFMRKCTVVVKKELFYAWPFGLAAWLCGLIFIPRMNSDKSRELMNDAAEEIIKNKIKLWVFPEGTRRNTGQIHPFKKGAFHIAIASKLPILPVVFSQYYFLDKANKRFDHGKVYITALQPIPTENLKHDDLEDLMERTRNVMSATFYEVNKEIKESFKKTSF